MKNTGVVGVIAVVLLLSGCASAGTESAPEVTVTAEVPTATPEPLVVETSAPAEASGDDATYLAEVRLRLKTITDASDEQLIASGHEACDRLAAGEAKDQIQLIDGEQQSTSFNIYADSYAITTWAAKAYCPEFDS